MKWIRQRFLRNSLDRQCPPVYGVSSDQPSQWEETVRKPAFQVVEAYVNGTEVETFSHGFRVFRETFSYENLSFHSLIFFPKIFFISPI